MPSIVITEKPDQARDVAAAVRSSYGQILPASGHIIRTKLPGEQDPAWKSWTYDLLMPSNGAYDFVPDDSSSFKKKSLDAILRALKSADTVYIATDCDREGQLIGQEILVYAGFKGKVFRVMFTATDQVTIQKAFQAAKPNSHWQSLYDAGFARLQGDQIYNLTLTRVATKALGDPTAKKAIGIGRVKTPTLGIVCARELEIANFKPEDYFDVTALIESRDVAGKPAKVLLSTSRPDDRRIATKVEADLIEQAARKFVGPLNVETKRQNVKPPRPYDLPSLQIAAGELKISPTRTAEIAQTLYETYKITTYPRAESRFLPEALINDAKRVFNDVARLPFLKGLISNPPLTRIGKDYTFSDKGLNGASHHAIIPNPNCPNGGVANVYSSLTGDEKAVFELIARQFAAALMDDLIQDVTSIKADIALPQGSEPFTASGTVMIYAGWRTVLPKTKDDDALPPIKDKEIGKTVETNLIKRTTKPPPRYSEPGLIKAMQEAWRFVQDPNEAERLKEAKGIGTPATRDKIIEDLKKQYLLMKSGSHIIPTEAGMQLYQTLVSAAPVLVDPAETARMESMLDDVLATKLSANDAIKDIAGRAGKIIPMLQAAGKTITITQSRTATASARKAPRTSSAKPARAGKSGGPRSTGAAPSARPTGQSSNRAAPSPSSSNAPSNAVAFAVTYDQRQQASQCGLRWDPNAKHWYAPNPESAQKAAKLFKRK